MSIVGKIGWIDITVGRAEAGAAACCENGGKVLIGPKAMGGGKFAVIKYAGGAVAALYQGP